MSPPIIDWNAPAGTYPYTKGIHPEMYRKQFLRMRLFAGERLAPDTNARFHALLARGATGLSTAMDLPTLMGRDSDNELSLSEVGWDGVAIDTIEDVIELYQAIDIGNPDPKKRITVSATINGPAAVFMAMYIAMAEERGIPRGFLIGTVQNDILKEYQAQKEWIVPVDAGVNMVAQTIEFAVRHMPKWNMVSNSGYHIREAGASAAEEIAITLANGLAYIRAAMRRGLSSDQAAVHISHFFDIHNDFVEEVAKIRAARTLWAVKMKEEIGATNEQSWKLKTHAQTAGCTLTREQPYNNIIRVTLQGFAAVAAGVQSLHTNSFDEVLCTPTERAAIIALRTQQIIKEETGITNYIDVFGDSSAIACRTKELFKDAWEIIDEIERAGGAVEATKSGMIERMIAASALRQEEVIHNGARKIVGCTIHHQDDEEYPVFAIEDRRRRRECEDAQIKRLRKIHSKRDNGAIPKLLHEIRRIAANGENIMESLIAAAHSRATLGEMCGALRDAYGTYGERDTCIPPRRTVAMEETAHSCRLARPVRILMAKGGLDGHKRPLYTLLPFLRDIGAEVVYPGLHCSINELVKRAREEAVEIIGISKHTGSPVRYFRALKKALNESGLDKTVTIIGGGIADPEEIKELNALGIAKFFPSDPSFRKIGTYLQEFSQKMSSPYANKTSPPTIETCTHVIGIQGAGGVGKSTLIGACITAFRKKEFSVAVIAIDPTESESGGALLGDALRMREHYGDPNVRIRSIGTRGSPHAIAEQLPDLIEEARRWSDIVIVETAGAGQSDTALGKLVDTYVVFPDIGGDAINLMKAGPQHHAHFLVYNTRGESDQNVEYLLSRFAASLPKRDGFLARAFTLNALGGFGIEDLVEAILNRAEFLKRNHP